jgi:hypothetical protein
MRPERAFGERKENSRFATGMDGSSAKHLEWGWSTSDCVTRDWVTDFRNLSDWVCKVCEKRSSDGVTWNGKGRL